MIWLEMSREEKHGGGEWSFQKCIWAPSHKKGTNNKWLVILGKYFKCKEE